MTRLDIKHTAFHSLVGLYIIWAVIFAILLGLAATNAFGDNNPEIGGALLVWICLNFFTGAALFIVIRIFRSKPVLTKFIRLSFIVLGTAAIALLALIFLKK